MKALEYWMTRPSFGNWLKSIADETPMYLSSEDLRDTEKARSDIQEIRRDGVIRRTRNNTNP